MASQLIDSMTAKWNPADYKDEFRAQLRKIIDQQIAKQSGKKVKAAKSAAEAPAEATTNVVDFMALLKKSLEKKGEKAPAAHRKRASAKRKKAASG